MIKVVIIANSKHKKALLLKSKLSELLGEGYIVADKLTKNKAHAIDLTEEAMDEGAAYIIAAGGDGTINEVINGYMKVTESGRSKVVLGLLPLGTGNDFARTVNAPKTVEELAGLIKNRHDKNIDIGKLQYQDEDGNIAFRYFNNIADVGVGAKTVEIVNNSRNIINGTITFFMGVLRAFVGYKRQSVKIKADDFNWSGKIVAVCIANGKYFGGGLGIAPNAEIDDGKLSLVIVGNINMLHFLWYLPRLRKLKLIPHSEVHYHKTTYCEITSLEKYPVEMDGENVGVIPLRVSVIPSGVRFLCADC